MSRALNYIYFTAPARFQAGPAVDWMLLAVHGFTLELIGLLDAAEAAKDKFSRLVLSCLQKL